MSRKFGTPQAGHSPLPSTPLPYTFRCRSQRWMMLPQAASLRGSGGAAPRCPSSCGVSYSTVPDTTLVQWHARVQSGESTPHRMQACLRSRRPEARLRVQVTARSEPGKRTAPRCMKQAQQMHTWLSTCVRTACQPLGNTAARARAGLPVRVPARLTPPRRSRPLLGRQGPRGGHGAHCVARCPCWPDVDTHRPHLYAAASYPRVPA
jgi:hypothetical protein